MHGKYLPLAFGRGNIVAPCQNEWRGNELTVDSAGTGGWHAGNPPDERSIAIAHQHDIYISQQSARQISADDFENFDLILAMDEDNLARLKAACPAEFRDRLHLFGSYTLGQRVNVPDPYYGGEDGFVTVYNMLFAGCSSLLEKMLAERAS